MRIPIASGHTVHHAGAGRGETRKDLAGLGLLSLIEGCEKFIGCCLCGLARRLHRGNRVAGYVGVLRPGCLLGGSNAELAAGGLSVKLGAMWR
jgi:hypothetical protein